MPDDPADAVLFAFKQKTEGRLDELEAEQARTRDELTTLRGDLARTHRVVMEVQAEMRVEFKKVLALLASRAGGT